MLLTPQVLAQNGTGSSSSISQDFVRTTYDVAYDVPPHLDAPAPVSLLEPFRSANQTDFELFGFQ